VPHDQKLLGFNIQISQYTCINSPIISDVQDEAIRAELMEHCNNCDVFLTRHEDSIITPHRHWLEQKFPGLKIRLPSELIAELA